MPNPLNNTDTPLSLYELAVDSDVNDLSGLSIVSIVADPAIQQRFQTFANDLPSAVSIQDDERHIVSGPALVPNMPIYRHDQTGEYYVTFTKQAIENMVQKYHQNVRANNSSFDHDGTLLNGVTMFESYIVDRSRGNQPNANYPKLQDGTWFVSFKVTNPEVWAAIKSGHFTGFSVEGLFNHIATSTKLGTQLESASQIYKGTSTSSESKPETIINKIFNSLSEIQKKLIQTFKVDPDLFGEAMLVDLSKISYDGEEIAIGNRVWLEDPAGNVSVLPDGDYLVRDSGTRFTIYDGFVSEVTLGQAPVEEDERRHQAQAADSNGTFEDEFPPKIEDMKKDPKKPYGDVEYADPGTQKDKVHRYPIDTEEHIRAAWNYINKGNASGDITEIKKRIIAAWKKMIDPKGPPSAQNNKQKHNKLMTKEQKRAALLAKHKAELAKFDVADNDSATKDDEIDEADAEDTGDMFANDLKELKDKNKALAIKCDALAIKCDDMAADHRALSDKFDEYVAQQKKAHEKFNATVEALSKLPGAKEIKVKLEREVEKGETVVAPQKLSAKDQLRARGLSLGN